METHTMIQYTFGTWNVCGLGEKKRKVLSEIHRENKDVVVLTETKLRGIGEENLGNYLHLRSGFTTGLARAGVSILLKKELAVNLKWKSISERLIMAEFDICGQSIVVIGVYWVDDCAKPAVKDAFQNCLKNTVESVPKERHLVILGDFNSRVGVHENSPVVGKYGEQEMNNNGRRLIELCKGLELKIQNTFFNHDDKHKYTWYHRQQNRKSLIDFCITRQDSLFVVDDVVACRWFECGTDHIYLETILSFEIQDCHSLVTEDDVNFRKYRTYLLFSKTVRNSYKDYLEDVIDMPIPRTSADIYQCLKNSIHSAASHVLGLQRKDNCSEFLWDQEIRDLLELRHKNKNPPQASSELFLEKYPTESQFTKIKNEVWDGICSEIDNAQKHRKNKVVWGVLNDIQNKSTRSQMYSEKLTYNVNTNCILTDSIKPVFPLDNTSISNQQYPENTYNVNIHDVCNALNHLDDYNVSVPGGLSIYLLRYSSSKCKKLLTNLIQNIFNGDEIPLEITETYYSEEIITADRIVNSKKRMYFLHSIMRVMRALVNDSLKKYVSFNEFNQVVCIEDSSKAVFILRQILQKCFEKQNLPIHIMFLDLKNLFSDIKLSNLFSLLLEKSIPKPMISIIKHLFEENFKGTCFSGDSSDITYNSSLLCTLLKMYLRKTLKAWSKENFNLGITMGNEKLLSLLLSDSKLVIFSESNSKMKLLITNLQLYLRNIGLTFDLKNTEYLSNENIEIDNVTIKGNAIVHFHDSVLEIEGRNVEEIYSRILDAEKAIGILHSVARDKMVSKNVKKRIFKSIIRNLLVYGCETWTMTEDLNKLFEDTEFNFWKWCCENYPQRYTKTGVFDMMNVKETVPRILMLKKAAWYTNIMENVHDFWVRNVLEWEPDGVGRCGRPRKKWADGLDEFIKSFRKFYYQKNKRTHKRNFVHIQIDSDHCKDTVSNSV